MEGVEEPPRAVKATGKNRFTLKALKHAKQGPRKPKTMRSIMNNRNRRKQTKNDAFDKAIEDFKKTIEESKKILTEKIAATNHALEQMIQAQEVHTPESLARLGKLSGYLQDLIGELDTIITSENDINTLIEKRDIHTVKTKEHKISEDVSELADLFARM